MIVITANLSIPEGDLEFVVSRSWGPGGQNVNKVSSRVTLRFDLEACTALTPLQRRRIRTKLATRVNKAGVLQVTSQRTRSQPLNRGYAVERFVELVREALYQAPPRIPTRATRSAKDRRVEEKKQHTEIKKARSSKGWEDL